MSRQVVPGCADYYFDTARDDESFRPNYIDIIVDIIMDYLIRNNFLTSCLLSLPLISSQRMPSLPTLWSISGHNRRRTAPLERRDHGRLWLSIRWSGA